IKTYGRLIGAEAIKYLDKKQEVHWDAPGQLWLTADYQPLMNLRRAHPLDSSWYIYGSTIEPVPDTVSAKIVNASLIADAVALDGGLTEDPMAYKLGALLIQKCGVIC